MRKEKKSLNILLAVHESSNKGHKNRSLDAFVADNHCKYASSHTWTRFHFSQWFLSLLIISEMQLIFYGTESSDCLTI